MRALRSFNVFLRSRVSVALLSRIAAVTIGATKVDGFGAMHARRFRGAVTADAAGALLIDLGLSLATDGRGRRDPAGLFAGPAKHSSRAAQQEDDEEVSRTARHIDSVQN